MCVNSMPQRVSIAIYYVRYYSINMCTYYIHVSNVTTFVEADQTPQRAICSVTPSHNVDDDDDARFVCISARVRVCLRVDNSL